MHGKIVPLGVSAIGGILAGPTSNKGFRTPKQDNCIIKIGSSSKLTIKNVEGNIGDR